ncbi:uncharacterized protein LOC120079339 isoform X2 [Benincasa hispida]|uniref:uncharacterized protein LOC120079339 isoform X2 n=1 Tax=Benincasa hispida TaxID=102211 RepID=UPI001900ADA0|nr:uncharacterized protein LOC120079339 isoform X2 [Benincasa hispida]
MVTRESWISVWIDRLLSCLGGIKPAPAISGNNLNSRMPSMSDDFWSTSTCDPDEMLTLQSRQNSFISTTNHNSNHGGGTDNLRNHSDFVNHGFVLWTQTRLRWVGNCVPAKRTKKNHLTGLSWYMTKELLLESKKPYHRRIPLSGKGKCEVTQN